MYCVSSVARRRVLFAVLCSLLVTCCLVCVAYCCLLCVVVCCCVLLVVQCLLVVSSLCAR